MLARLFLATRQVPQARLALEQAAAEHPQYAGVYLTFAQLALAEGRLTDAQLHFERAAVLKPQADKDVRDVKIESQKGLAAIAEQRQDWQAAKLAVSSWLELEPANGRARRRLAHALFQLDQQTEAYEELQRAERDDDSADPAAIAMAWLYERKGNREKAQEWIDYALKAAKDDPKVRYAYADWLLHLGELGDAKTNAQQAASLDPGSAQAKRLCGQVERALKSFPKAEDYFRAALKLAPDDFPSVNLLALALIEQDDRHKQREALQLAEQTLRQYPNSREALSTLGRIYYRFGRSADAERALSAAASSGPINSQTAYFLAHVMADRGRLPDARQLLKVALDAPGFFPYRSDAEAWIERLPSNTNTELAKP